MDENETRERGRSGGAREVIALAMPSEDEASDFGRDDLKADLAYADHILSALKAAGYVVVRRDPAWEEWCASATDPTAG